MYKVVWTQGNGFHCRCCRQTWEEERVFTDRCYAEKFAFKQRNLPIYEDASNVRIITDGEEEDGEAAGGEPAELYKQEGPSE